MKVLITGGRGTIGSKLGPALEGDYELRLLSRQEMEGDDWWQVDVTDIGAVHEAMAGMDAVIHLAIATGREGDFEGDAFNAQRLDINAKGAYNIFEAARRLLTEPDLAESFTVVGRQRARKFTWAECAKSTLLAYRNAQESASTGEEPSLLRALQ